LILKKSSTSVGTGLNAEGRGERRGDEDARQGKKLESFGDETGTTEKKNQRELGGNVLRGKQLCKGLSKELYSPGKEKSSREKG